MCTKLSETQLLKINKAARRVLHVQGNAPKGDVLEMALVLDCSLERGFLCEASKDILTFMRKEGGVFLNMRINLIKWKGDEDFVKYVTSYPEILMGRAADETDITQSEKHYDALLAQLKKFYARSKLVLIISQEGIGFADADAVAESLKPFLDRKIISVCPDGSLVYPFEVRS